MTVILLGLMALTLGACTGNETADTGTDRTMRTDSERMGPVKELFPDVIDAELAPQGGDKTVTVDVPR